MNMPAWMRPPRRSEERERLDSPEAYPLDLGASLAEVRRVNRRLGGTAVALGFMRQRPALVRGASATVLDVATGTADIPRALVGWAAGSGVRLTVTATDVSPEVLAHASRHVQGLRGITLALADATDLPYPDASFDYVTCNLALHHFPPDQAVEVMREMYRVASRAILVNDLERSRPAYWSARLVFMVTTRNVVTAHDGPLSVLRAYTRSELRELAVRAGLPNPAVRRRSLFRLELVAEK